MKALILSLLLCVAGAVASDTNKPATYIGKHLRGFPGPQAYKDAESGVVFYVESDGRHLAAIGKDAKVLWHRDPFTDAHLQPYRTDKPQIISIGQPMQWMLEAVKGKGSGKFICIYYNSSQAGLVDMKNGDFFFMGQD